MRRMLLLALIVVTMTTALPQQKAAAGPLLDWWKSRPKLFGKKTEPVVAYMPPVGTCQTTCQQTCQRVSVSYVPQTSYRSTWVQTPITSYRPTTTTDPLTGCQVTCVKPCTTYQWSLKRIPYTTYRPVYQTHSVQMPAVSACNSCSVQPTIQQSMVVPGTTTPIAVTGPGTTNITTQPNMGIPGGGFSGGTPADMQPTMNPNTSSRVVIPQVYDANGNPIGSSILNGSSSTSSPPSGGGVAPMSGTVDRAPRRIETGNSQLNQHSPIIDPSPNSRRSEPNAAPPLLPTDLNTVDVTLRRPWEYSPVRLAVYEDSVRSEPQRLNVETFEQPATHQVPETRQINTGWRSMSR